MHRIRAAIALCLLTLPASGCTAGLATIRVLAAEKAMRQAADSGAEELAPYEFTLAQRHLDKAVEESATNEYKTCIELAKKAEALAQEAKVVAEGGTRSLGELGDIDETLTDEGAPSEDEGSSLSDGPGSAPVPSPDEGEPIDDDLFDDEEEEEGDGAEDKEAEEEDEEFEDFDWEEEE